MILRYLNFSAALKPLRTTDAFSLVCGTTSRDKMIRVRISLRQKNTQILEYESDGIVLRLALSLILTFLNYEGGDEWSPICSHLL